MRRLYILFLVLFISACGGGSVDVAETSAPPPPASACPLPDQQQYVRNFMDKDYFWWDRHAPGDASSPTIAAFFESMLYKPVDRYSFTEPTATYEQRVLQGQRVGYGYTLAWMDAARSELRVRNVEPLGPAALAGLRRGQQVMSIDGYSLQEISQGKVPAVSQPGVARTLVLQDNAGAEKKLEMVSAQYPLTVVPASAVLHATNEAGEHVKVGYLAYQSFVLNANGRLGEAMQAFGDAGVRELVLDLRYNGGGSVAVARDLASMIGGDKVRGKLFTYLRYNANNVARNQASLFRPDHFALPAPSLKGLQRLIVLSSPSMASASELVVNGLKPFMPVVLVGGTTYGKPYGSVVRHHCGTTYHGIQFTSLNALGTADYANGFAPDCEVADDLGHELGDVREGRLAAALHFVRTGQCPATVQPPPMAMPRGARGLALAGEVERPVMLLD